MRGDIMRGLNIGVNTYNCLNSKRNIMPPLRGSYLILHNSRGFAAVAAPHPGYFTAPLTGAQKFGSLTLAGAPHTTTNLLRIPRRRMPAEIRAPVEGRYMVARRWSRVSGGTPGKRTNKQEPRLRGDIMRGLNIGVNTYNCLNSKRNIMPPLWGSYLILHNSRGFSAVAAPHPGYSMAPLAGLKNSAR